MDLRTPVPLSDAVLSSGVCLLEGLVQGDALVLLEQLARIRLSSGTIPLEPGRCDAHALYGDPGVEALFAVLSPKLKHLIGGAVPSYGYMRVYTRGSDLAPHVDREACEFTLTVALCGVDAGRGWTLHARSLAGEHLRYSPNPGDGVLIRGREVLHWREPLTSGWAAYAFLHWVEDRIEAPRFDGRPGLGFNSTRAHQ